MHKFEEKNQSLIENSHCKNNYAFVYTTLSVAVYTKLKKIMFMTAVFALIYLK